MKTIWSKQATQRAVMHKIPIPMKTSGGLRFKCPYCFCLMPAESDKECFNRCETRKGK